MNIQARTSIHKCTDSLNNAMHALQEAADNVENGTMKKEIEDQLNQVTKCMESCRKISSGLSQHQHDSYREEFYGKE